MAFQHGLSGINAASKQLDAIGNNVANSSTVGFKGSRAEFADMFAANFYGVAATQNGIGVNTTLIAQQFGQGKGLRTRRVDLLQIMTVDHDTRLLRLLL